MPTHDPKIESLVLPISDGIEIAAIRQREPGVDSDHRVLCLHGWLDNANSFVPMMPFLPDMDLVAVDLPGHGYSSHLQGPYNVLDTTVRCLEIAKALGWDRFHVVGHSLGGSMAMMMAAAAGDHIESCTSIESAGPLAEAAEKFPDRLKRAAADRANPDKFASRSFDSMDDAINVRLKAAKMDRVSAGLIIRRQTKTTDAGIQWRL